MAKEKFNRTKSAQTSALAFVCVLGASCDNSPGVAVLDGGSSGMDGSSGDVDGTTGMVDSASSDVDSATGMLTMIESLCRAETSAHPVVSQCVGNGDCADGARCFSLGENRFCAQPCSSVGSACGEAAPATCESLEGEDACVPDDVCPYATTMSDCVEEFEAAARSSESAGCSGEFSEFIACLSAMGPFCDSTEREAACGAEFLRWHDCTSNP